MGDSRSSSTPRVRPNLAASVSNTICPFPSDLAMGDCGFFCGIPSWYAEKCLWCGSWGEEEPMGVVNALRAWTLGVAIGEVDVREDVEVESRRLLDFSL
jgi:hypothetical protein